MICNLCISRSSVTLYLVDIALAAVVLSSFLFERTTMSVQCTLRSLTRVNYAALHTGTDCTPERAVVNKAWETAINSPATDSPATVGGLADASQVDAPTLEAPNLRQEITQAKLARQRQEKEREVVELRNELAALQRDQLDQKAVRTHHADKDKKSHESSLVVEDLRKNGFLDEESGLKVFSLGSKG